MYIFINITHSSGKAKLHIFAKAILLMKKLEIEKTKPTFIISVLKVEYLGGLSFFDFLLFY